MTVFLTGLTQKAYSNMDLISLSVGLYGIFVTCQNTALTLLGSLGVVKGGIFMVVTLLVVGVFGMWIHRESCEYATVRVQILVKRQAAHTRRIPPIFHTAYRNAVGLCLFVFEIVYDTIAADTACKQRVTLDPPILQKGTPAMKKQKQVLSVILLFLQIALTATQLVGSQSSTAPVINVSGIDNTVIVLPIGD